MKKQTLGSSDLMVPSIAVGCMRIDAMEDRQLDSYLAFCLENGLNFFDHADIYGKGICETKFGQAVKRMGVQREDIILQSKCGIVPGIMYDFSK